MFVFVRFRLPARLPFSRTVPEGLRAVLSFVAAYYDFLVGFPSGYAEFDDLIRVVGGGRFRRPAGPPTLTSAVHERAGPRLAPRPSTMC